METAPAIAYLALSFAFNAILTILLMWRILIARCYLRKSFGGDHGQLYTSLAWLIVQSASPYIIVALMAIIVTGLNSPLQYALLPMLGQLQAIPTLVIMRWVVDGRLSHQTGNSPQQSRLQFKTDAESAAIDVAYNGDYFRPKSPYRAISPLSLEIPSDRCKYYEDVEDSPADSCFSVSYPEKAILSPASTRALIAPEPPSRHSSIHSAVLRPYILTV
ncbi:hypothetical protein EIP86_004043 [Pleurotus ostreatoroseus]|nr:hypothetical protein EIP86_004043 [Pleurotus ostreatoroseus]